MKLTKNAINRALPRVAYYRRRYRLPDQTGICPDQTLSRVFCDVLDGSVRITDYAYGDAMAERHYYAYRYTNVFDITDVITEWQRGNLDRSETVDKILLSILSVDDKE